MGGRALTILLGSAVLVATTSAPAAATTMKTLAGATVASGSSLSGLLKAGTTWHLEGGPTGDVDCSTSTLGGTLGTNPSTLSVGGSLTSLTFSSCTDTIPFVTLSSVTTNVGTGSNAKTLSFTYVPPGTSSTLTVAGLEFTTTFSNGSTCVYQATGGTATATHNSNAGNNEYVFNAVWFTKTGGTFALCPSSSVTATWTWLLVTGSAGITIQP